LRTLSHTLDTRIFHCCSWVSHLICYYGSCFSNVEISCTQMEPRILFHTSDIRNSPSCSCETTGLWRYLKPLPSYRPWLWVDPWCSVQVERSAYLATAGISDLGEVCATDKRADICLHHILSSAQTENAHSILENTKNSCENLTVLLIKKSASITLLTS
jgi:hypothetical protein